MSNRYVFIYQLVWSSLITAKDPLLVTSNGLIQEEVTIVKQGEARVFMSVFDPRLNHVAPIRPAF